MIDCHRRHAVPFLFLFNLTIASAVGLTAAEKVPEFKLKDPAGKEHTQKDLLDGTTVVMISIPNAKHGGHQERWMDLLDKAMPGATPQFVILQDLSQSNVVEEATEGMKERFRPGQRPLLLVDTTGDVRRAFGVPQDETTLLVCDRKGAIVHRVSDITDPDEVREAVKGIVKAAEKLGPVSSAERK